MWKYFSFIVIITRDSRFELQQWIFSFNIFIWTFIVGSLFKKESFQCSSGFSFFYTSQKVVKEKCLEEVDEALFYCPIFSLEMNREYNSRIFQKLFLLSHFRIGILSTIFLQHNFIFRVDGFLIRFKKKEQKKQRK